MLKACLTSCAALAVAPFVVVLFAVGCGTTPHEPIVVNRLDDLAEPPEGIVTLRSALASAASGQPIVFDASLDGGVIELSIVGNAHTVLKGEVMGMLTTANENGTTVVMVTHSQTYAGYANRVIHLFDGKIISESMAEAAHA